MKPLFTFILLIGAVSVAEPIEIIIKRPEEKKAKKKEELKPVQKLTKLSIAALNDTALNFDILIHVQDKDNAVRNTAMRAPALKTSAVEIGTVFGPPNTTFELTRLDVKIGDRLIDCYAYTDEKDASTEGYFAKESILVYVTKKEGELIPTCSVYLDREFLDHS